MFVFIRCESLKKLSKNFQKTFKKLSKNLRKTLTSKLGSVQCASCFGQDLKQTLNTNEMFNFSQESSLTISYHAICVNTHINLFLPS